MVAIGYEIVEPEPTVRPVAEIAWSPRLVDYESHAAYRDLVARPSLAARIEALTIFAAGMAKLLVKRAVKYEFIPYDIRADSTPGGRLRFLGAALRNIGRGNARARNLSAAEVDTGRMARHGIHVVTMPADRFETLDACANPEFESLVVRRGHSNGQRAFEDSRGQASRRQRLALFNVIEETLRDAGLFQVASAYLGHEARLIDVNPQINDTTDSFWRDIFPDADLNTIPATAYCHRDASGGDLKAIIYMTDVDDRTGPFSYVVGSNRMRISRVDDLICEANDSNGLSGTDAVSRARFAALPPALRQKGSFGNDLSPESVLGREIGGALWKVTAGRGSIVLFDTKGIHRGGMVEDGERRVITCVIG